MPAYAQENAENTNQGEIIVTARAFMPSQQLIASIPHDIYKVDWMIDYLIIHGG